MRLTNTSFGCFRYVLGVLVLMAGGSACTGEIIPPGALGSTGQTSSGSGGTTGGTGGAGVASGGSDGTTDGTGGAGVASGGSGGSGSGSGSSGSSGSGSGSGSGSPGSGGSGSGNGSSGSGGAICVPAALPPDVEGLLSFCSGCHGSTPLAGAPALVTADNLRAPSTVNGSQTNAQRALVRLQSTSSPMPPAGSPRPSAAQVASLQAWVDGGYPMAACPAGSGSGGASGGGGSSGSGGASGSGGNPGTGGSDPFAGPSVCTSKTMWTGGNHGSASMNPGKACIACHKMGEGPSFAVAGTLFPTAHEPDLCNGTNGSTTGARVVITDAAGKAITLTPNAAGNFSYQGALSTPFTASVTYMGRERKMLTPQTNGDCNSCHTTSGAMSAPGRILLP